MEPCWADLVYGTGPTTSILCTGSLFLSTRRVTTWMGAVTEAIWQATWAASESIGSCWKIH